jgi:hypothetical protein
MLETNPLRQRIATLKHGKDYKNKEVHLYTNKKKFEYDLNTYDYYRALKGIECDWCGEWYSDKSTKCPKCKQKNKDVGKDFNPTNYKE